MKTPRSHPSFMARRATRAIAVAIAAVAIAAGPGHAAPSEQQDGTSPEAVHETVVGNRLFVEPGATRAIATSSLDGNVTLQAASYTITCAVDAQNPHISDGARSRGQIYVIYKSVVTCTGTGAHPAKATIRVRGGLMYDKADFSGDTRDGISWQMIRSSDDTRIVSVNGSKNTFYTPKSSEYGATLTGHYQGSSTVEIVSPAGFKVGSDISGVVFCRPTTLTARCS